MKLKKLQIHTPWYGPHKGKLVAEISYKSDIADTTIILPDETASDILKYTKNLLLKGLSSSHQELKEELEKL